ncbi:MAG: phosphoribosylglycinamide formyltransferase [Gammaproteobacteria bacterium RIFCSPHIGHO2_12_FULL_45_12]|nr:MAG: phosphoribosylglycinamide formyltransferase [Gammaproteobacteria bacterium RIFCSPHIGHO2_12_FULL_45_12]
MIRLGILGSTRGSSMAAIVDAIQEKKLAAEVVVVLSNQEEAQILTRASDYQIPAFYIDASGLTREAYDEKLTACLQRYGVELLVLIGYMRILSDSFVKTWEHHVMNVHPSLLPAFSGMMDMQVHQAVIDAGVSETGCTVHYVVSKVDAGPIVLQKKCQVLNGDTAETLKIRVQQLEREALCEAIALYQTDARLK